MQQRRSGPPVGNLILVALCIALTGLIYVRLEGDAATHSVGDVEPATRRADTNQPKTRADGRDVFRPAPLDAYAEVVARPLFNRTRRPIAAATDGRKTTGSTLHSVHLVGIVIDAGGPVAFLRVEGGTQILSVRAGGAVDGWVVESIGSDSVTLAGKGDVARLTTKNEKPQAEKADRSSVKQTPKAVIGKQEGPGQKANDNKD